jgi:hypothetical protein
MFILILTVLRCFCLFQAHIEQWMDFAATEVDASIGKWLYPRMGFYPYAAVVCVAMWLTLFVFFKSLIVVYISICTTE